MKNVRIIIIALFVILYSCSSSIDKDLGSGYLLYVGDGYSTTVLNSEKTVMIPSEILDHAFDSTFILATQRPWDSIPGVAGLKFMTYKERSETFENSPFKQYWIINKKEKSNCSFDSISKRSRYSNVYGPFDKQEYMEKRKEVGVPRELKLKEE